jgi:hypothetical protein
MDAKLVYRKGRKDFAKGRKGMFSPLRTFANSLRSLRFNQRPTPFKLKRLQPPA